MHTAQCIETWFNEHDDYIRNLHRPATLSPDLNIIDPMWDILENKVRGKFPLPATVKELASALVEEWNKFDINDVHDLYLSIFYFHLC